MRKFDIPTHYKSSFIGAIKDIRKEQDPKKKSFSPTLLDFGPVKFLLARHFGFCFGVENAIEIAYKTVEENPGKRIFLLSQMIHNPHVNEDLISRGIQFIMDTSGNQLIEWNSLKTDDIVIIPAFGTTLEIEKKMQSIGLSTTSYNTTCPFVERVWKKSKKLGEDHYTIVIHGKHNHEETRATFSHSQQEAPSIVVKDIKETKKLGDFILGKLSQEAFQTFFQNRCSTDFNVATDLVRIGVVNQTTMLATETQEIADYLKEVMIQKYGAADINNHYADTRDTLCYATNDNQEATYHVLKERADMAVVVGGYNSSNTSHIVELCEEKVPTFFISSDEKINSKNEITHFDIHHSKEIESAFISIQNPTIILTSGASCPDTLVEKVLDKILNFYPHSRSKEEVYQELLNNHL